MPNIFRTREPLTPKQRDTALIGKVPDAVRAHLLACPASHTLIGGTLLCGAAPPDAH